VITYNLNLTNTEARIYSIDGQPLAEPWPLTASYPLPVGQRLDVAIKMPIAGEVVSIKNGDVIMATLKAVANNQPKVRDFPKPLPPNAIPKPNLERATTMRFTFGWSTKMLENLEQEDIYQFWQINGQAWDVKDITCAERPIAKLKRNQHYIFELHNLTQYEHPIHLHGMHFWVFESNKKSIKPHFADTYLLDGFETAKVALVAANVGTWMFHCHVLDHLETGMMGAIKVE